MAKRVFYTYQVAVFTGSWSGGMYCSYNKMQPEIYATLAEANTALGNPHNGTVYKIRNVEED